MTTYKQLEEAAKELEIGTDLGEEVRNIPRHHAKWMRYLHEFAVKTNAQEKKLKEMIGLRQEWYQDRLSTTKLAELGWEMYNWGVDGKSARSNNGLPEDKLKRLLDGDGLVNAEREKLFQVKLCLEFCEEKLKLIMKRGQDLKVLLEWEKYKNGVF